MIWFLAFPEDRTACLLCSSQSWEKGKIPFPVESETILQEVAFDFADCLAKEIMVPLSGNLLLSPLKVCRRVDEPGAPEDIHLSVLPHSSHSLLLCRG